MYSTQLVSLIGMAMLTYISYGQDKTIGEIDHPIDLWHEAAAKAEFETYSGLMTKDAVFIGTDPTEYWQGKAFRDFAKPYFDRGKAWTFHKLSRKVYIDAKNKIAWFDELLDTQMGICRGSGVLELDKNTWKIKHYALSITIPNDNVEKIKSLNSTFNTSLIENLSRK